MSNTKVQNTNDVGAGDEWEETRRDFWKPESEGEVCEGFLYPNSWEINTKMGKAKAVRVGDVNVLVGSSLFLDDLEGCYIRIMYEGMRHNDNTKRDYRSYKVAVNRSKGKLAE